MKTLLIYADNSIIDAIQEHVKNFHPTVKISIQKTANETIKEIIDCLNSVCGTAYKATTKPTIAHISARIAEGYTLEDFRHVICFKNDEWGPDPHWSKFLRPETLFGNKFESYLMAAKKDSAPAAQFTSKKPEVAL